MGADSRKTFRIFSGLKLHTDKNDFGATIGGDKLSITTGTKGTSVNVGIPGTNITYKKKLSTTKSAKTPKNETVKETDRTLAIKGAIYLGYILGAIIFVYLDSFILSLVPMIVLITLVLLSNYGKE